MDGRCSRASSLARLVYTRTRIPGTIVSHLSCRPSYKRLIGYYMICIHRPTMLRIPIIAFTRRSAFRYSCSCTSMLVLVPAVPGSFLRFLTFFDLCVFFCFCLVFFLLPCELLGVLACSCPAIVSIALGIAYHITLLHLRCVSLSCSL